MFLETLLPAAPDVPVQIAHLAGSGGYDEEGVDAALGVFVDAIAAKDPRVAKLWFDVSGIALIGSWPGPAARVAERIRHWVSSACLGRGRRRRRHDAGRSLEGVHGDPPDAREMR